MKLQTITTGLNTLFYNLPEVKIVKQNNLTDSIYIMISLDKRGTWANGILENSRYIKAFIFRDDSQYLPENDNTRYSFEVVSNRTGIKLLQRKGLTGEQVYNHVIKQLNKLKEAII